MGTHERNGTGHGGNGHAPRDASGGSKMEQSKRASRRLRGTIADGLRDRETDRFADGDLGILKFHGIYQQYDRDARLAGRQAKEDRTYSLMVRLRLPGGALDADQWLALDDLARRYGHGSLRLTTRQSIQFHGVLKGDIDAHVGAINAALLTTLAACGDIARNIMCCPATDGTALRAGAQRAARDVAAALLPGTRAYHEIWVDGERRRLGTNGTPESEPLYGDAYLPRKFKTAVALPDDNCVDVHTQDCGLVAVPGPDGGLVGFNVLVGGGLGMTHGKADTFARLGTLAGFVPAARAVETVRTAVTIFRDFGDRDDRRHARLKYVIEARGMDWFRAEFAHRAGFAFDPPAPLPPIGHRDHLGRADQGDGRVTYGVFLENGRLRDGDGRRPLDAVRAIVARFRPNLRVTPGQDLLLVDLDPDAVPAIESVLREHGVPTPDAISRVRLHAMACPALPTCGLALADAERALPGIVDELEPILADLGVDRDDLAVRMTGCPNGCARPYTADIAFVGRGPELYDVFVGGRLAGDRLVDLLAEKVARDDVVETLRPVLEAWSAGRRAGEGLGDWWQRRHGRTAPKTLLTGEKTCTPPPGADVAGAAAAAAVRSPEC